MVNERTFALVTGANSIIGMEIARQLAKKKYNLVLSDHSIEALEKLSEETEKIFPSLSIHKIPIDLSSPEGASLLFSSVQALRLDIEVLVNNAEFSVTGKFDSLPLAQYLKMIQLNIASLTELMHLFLPLLKKKKKGYILNIASSAGLIPAGPFMAVYCATKSYVVSLSLATNEELKKTGVSVTALCTETSGFNFLFKNKVKKTLAKIKENSDPSKIARNCLKSLFSRRNISTPGFMNQVILFLGKFLPRSFVVSIVARIFK